MEKLDNIIDISNSKQKVLIYDRFEKNGRKKNKQRD